MTNSSGKRSSEFTRALGDDRRRARELLAAQQALIDSLEGTLLEELERASGHPAHAVQARLAEQQLDRRADQLARQASDLAATTAELLEREAALEALERSGAATDKPPAGEAAPPNGEKSAGRAKTRLGGQLASELKQLEQERAQLAAEREHLAAERDRLAALETQTRGQRRRIARELQVQRATQIAELERRRLELKSLSVASHAEVAEQLATAQREAQEQRQQAAQLRKLLNARAEELTELRGHAAEMVTEIESLRAAQNLPAHAADDPAAADATRDERAQAEIARLEAVCADLELKLTAGGQPAGSPEAPAKQHDKLYEMQRRFELAVDDVRDLKRRNADLESRLVEAQTGQRAVAGLISTGGLDWDTQKRQLLAALEADVDDEDEERRQERLSIESTISITDHVVAEKDREIGELKQLLHDQSSNLGSVAVGATAIAGILDQDELVRQEREKLAQLQADLQHKLSQAEVDISLERAKIARDRAEIEDKLATYKADMADRKAAGPAAVEAASHGKPIRGRWLARLGLKDLEE